MGIELPEIRDRQRPLRLPGELQPQVGTGGPLDVAVQRDLRDPIERASHSRSSVLQRLLTHEAYHCGELSQTLGIEGLPQIDLWRSD